MTTDSTTPIQGRPVAGAISGLFFGIFLTFALLQMSVFALDSNLVVIVPIAMLILGGVWGYFAPLKFLRGG
jgi:hypothetical protein